MCEDLDAIMKYWEQDEMKSKGIYMTYRKEENNKVANQSSMAKLLFIVVIMGMISTLILCFSKQILDYLIPFMFFLLTLIFIAMYLNYFLFQEMNYGYTIEIRNNKLVYTCKHVTKTLDLPFAIYQRDVPFALFYYEETIVLTNSDDESDQKPNFGILSNDIVLCNTVNEEGKELIDFLMEANSLFLSDEQEAP